MNVCISALIGTIYSIVILSKSNVSSFKFISYFFSPLSFLPSNFSQFSFTIAIWIQILSSEIKSVELLTNNYTSRFFLISLCIHFFCHQTTWQRASHPVSGYCDNNSSTCSSCCYNYSHYLRPESAEASWGVLHQPTSH